MDFRHLHVRQVDVRPETLRGPALGGASQLATRTVQCATSYCRHRSKGRRRQFAFNRGRQPIEVLPNSKRKSIFLPVAVCVNCNCTRLRVPVPLLLTT